MLMSPNEDKTVVHGCCYPSEIAVCMGNVLGILQSLGVCSSLLNLVLLSGR